MKNPLQDIDPILVLNIYDSNTNGEYYKDLKRVNVNVIPELLKYLFKDGSKNKMNSCVSIMCDGIALLHIMYLKRDKGYSCVCALDEQTPLAEMQFTSFTKKLNILLRSHRLKLLLK